jgi:RES domain-containing protein
MLIWRLTTERLSAIAFTGEGAAADGRRWNPELVAVVYTASSLALAALEYFVNVASPRLGPPLVAIPCEVPDALRIEVVPDERLPVDWRSVPYTKSTQEVGLQWVREGGSALLSVPSAVVPQERNYVLNPAHHDFKRIRIGKPQPFSFDPRMWK